MKAKVLVATPVPKDVRIDVRTLMYLQNEMAEYASQGWKWTIRVGYSAENSRNDMVDEMFKGDYTHIYFVDADTIPSVGSVGKLLTRDKDIVAGITPIWNGGERRWSYQVNANKPVPVSIPPKELFKVARTGGTTVLIKRKVFEKIPKPYFQTTKNYVEEFKTFVYKTDDYFFCDNAIKNGFDIWIDPTVVCGHMNYVNLLDIFKEMYNGSVSR